MEGSCSTGQSPQRAVVPMEEEEEEEEEEDEEEEVVLYLLQSTMFHLKRHEKGRQCMYNVWCVRAIIFVMETQQYVSMYC
jgi:hypothetical protein